MMGGCLWKAAGVKRLGFSQDFFIPKGSSVGHPRALLVHVRILAGFSLAAAMWAQPAFQNLAPIGDGSAVYFSSSLRMKGTAQYPSQPKIFVWNEKGGVQLYEQKPPTIGPLSVEGWESSTAYNLLAPSISSDGRTIAITGLSDCTDAEICAVDLNRYQAEIRVAGGAPLVMDGPPSVSPNGRFVGLGSPILAPFGDPELTVLDLSTGQQKQVGTGLGFARRHGVANDGTALPAAEQFWAGAPQVDASDARRFYEADSASPDTLDLTALDVATGAVTRLTSVETAGAAVPFDISDDGSLVAFVQLGQMWTIHGDGSGLMQIPNVQDPVVEVALSGSGSHLFAITSNSHMLRINLTTLVVEEIIPATPAPSGLYFQPLILTPGGYCDVVTTMQPIPELQSISLFGHDFAVLTVSPGVIQLQVPYDIPEGTGWPDAVLKQQPDGPFESAMLWSKPAEVSGFNPTWFSAGNNVAALHQDFSGLVTLDNPAHPGEIIHAYGSGFGPVAPEPAFGQPASANPLSRITTPLACGLAGDNSTLVLADIRFAGLAPGWIGLYQLDILLPTPPSGGGAGLVCGRAKNPQAGNYASGFLPMAAK
jgi:uncharacterized protein (TIGR03437 family)